MKKILSIIFILTMVALTGCFGGKESTKEVTYEGQLKKLKVDVQKYQTNIKRAGVNTLLGEGIYINVLAEDGIAGYEGWYYYDLATITGVANEQLQELLTLMGVVGPKGRVYFVFGDNYVNPFDYTSIEDTRDNGTPMDKVEPTTEIKQVKVGAEPTVTTAISTGTNTKPYATGAVTTTTGGVQFAYANQISTGVVNFYKGETFTVSSAAITTAAGVAKVAVVLPATIGADTVYTVKSNEIYFGTNNSVTVEPKAAPTITTVTAISGTAIKAMVNMTNYTAAELTGKEVWLESDTTSFAAVFASVTTGGIVMNTAEALTDTAIYTVTSDFFTVGTVSFTAKIGAEKKILEAKTTNIVASTSPSAFFTVNNQYGKALEISTTPATVTVTKNDLPVQLWGDVTIVDNAIKVQIHSKVLENDVLKYTFAGKGFESATLSYTVVKGEHVGDVTSAEDFSLEATKTSIAAKDTVTFTAIGVDPYDSPVVFGGTDITWYITGPNSYASGPTAGGAEKVFTPTTPGAYTVRAALTSNTQINKTVNLLVDVAGLTEVNITTVAAIGTTRYSQEGPYYLFDVFANVDAEALTAGELVATVTNSTINLADLGVELVTSGTGVAVKVSPTSAGSFALKLTATRGEVTVSTESALYTVGINPAVKSMEVKIDGTVYANNSEIEVKEGEAFDTDLAFTFFNGNGDEVNVAKVNLIVQETSSTYDNLAHITTVKNGDPVTSGTIQIRDMTNTTETFKLKFTVNGTNPEVSYEINVNAKTPTLAAIGAVADVTEANAIVAGDSVDMDKYHVLTFTDEEGADIIIADSKLKVTVTTPGGTNLDNATDIVTLTNAAITGTGWITSGTAVTVNAGETTVNAICVSAKAGLSQGEYTVKIESNDNAAVSKTFKVYVGSDRSQESITFDTLTFNLVEGAEATLKFTVKDQYQELINVTPADITVVTTGTVTGLVNYGTITELKKGEYSMPITAGAVGAGTYTIKLTYSAIDGTKIESNVVTINVVELGNVNRIEIVTTAAVTMSAVGKADPRYDVGLKVKAYDSSNNEIVLTAGDVTWSTAAAVGLEATSLSALDTPTTTLKLAEGTGTVTVTAIVSGKTATYSLTVDNDYSIIADTISVTTAGNITITSGSSLNVKFKAQDQFGEVTSPVAIVTTGAISADNTIKVTYIQSSSSLVTVPTISQITTGDISIEFVAAANRIGSTKVIITFVDKNNAQVTKEFTVEVVK